MIIRKEHVIVASVFVMAVVATILCAFYIPVNNSLAKGVVVVDAGHGGMDGGVSYAPPCPLRLLTARRTSAGSSR